jgi:hypothetical protein
MGRAELSRGTKRTIVKIDSWMVWTVDKVDQVDVVDMDRVDSFEVLY